MHLRPMPRRRRRASLPEQFGDLPVIGERVLLVARPSLFTRAQFTNVDQGPQHASIVIAEEADETVRPYADHLIEIPAVSMLFQPPLPTIPLQVFAASLAQAQGYDIDKPRNLTKSVTVE